MRRPPPMLPALLSLLALAGCGGGIIKNQPHDTGTPQDETPPDIYLSTSSYDFGTLTLGDRVSTAVSVENLGTEDLVISEVASEAPFEVTPTTLTVQGGSSSTITVTVATSDYAPHAGDVVISSNDADSPTVTFTVSVATVTDADGDGHALIGAGGDDCDDENADVNPDAVEIYYDDIDENCDGRSDWDQDGDGYETDTHNANPDAGGGDCQDLNVDYHPGAADVPYDNRDTNCDNADDYDADGDGSRSDDYGAGTDCDDTDPTVNTSGVETMNAKDDDCDGLVDVGASGAGAPYQYEAVGRYDHVGWATALADVDGDGNADVVVGSPDVGSSTPNGSGKGSVSVFLAAPLAVTGSQINDADTYFTGTGATDLLGYAVSKVGDFDADGIDDIAVSAPGTNSGAGTVYVISGTAAAAGGDTSSALLTLTGASGEAAGRGLGSDIDLDGDGVDDLVTCYASGTDNAVALVYGPASGSMALSAADAVYTTDGTGTAFYRNAPVGGDLDGDGYTDLLLADGAADYGYTDNGALWALFGQPQRYGTSGAADIEIDADVLVSGTANTEGNAWAVGLGGDLDGDGDQELWVYAAGVALYGIEGGPSRRSSFSPAAEAAVTYTWGTSSADVDMIRSIGDWTGDGLADILVVAEDASGSYGRAELFGSEIWDGGVYSERSDLTASLLGTSDDGNGNLGYGQCAVPGDVDGDGDPDIVSGDPEADTFAGRAYVFLNQPAE